MKDSYRLDVFWVAGGVVRLKATEFVTALENAQSLRLASAVVRSVNIVHVTTVETLVKEWEKHSCS